MSQSTFRLIDCRTEQGILIATVRESRLQDERAADGLQAELVTAIGEHQAANVVLDLGNIKYVSSIAFRPLLHVRRKLQDAQGRLILCNLSAIVGDVFYTTRLVSPDGSFAAPFELAANIGAAVDRITGAAGKHLSTD